MPVTPRFRRAVLALALAAGSLPAAAQSGSEAVVCVGSEARTLQTNPIRRVYTEDMEIVYRIGVDIGQRDQMERTLSSELGSYPEVWCAWSDPGDDHAVIISYTGVIRQDLTVVAAEDSEPEFDLPEGPICTGDYSPDSCWMELVDRPGCYLWNPAPQEDVTVTWSGGCSNGLAQGEGRVDWFSERCAPSDLGGTSSARAGRGLGNYEPVQLASQWALSHCGVQSCRVVMTFNNQCAAFAADQARGSTICGWAKTNSVYAAQNNSVGLLPAARRHFVHRAGMGLHHALAFATHQGVTE